MKKFYVCASVGILLNKYEIYIYKMWLNCYEDFDVARLDRILAHSLMNINTVYMKNDKVLYGVLKLLHDTYIGGGKEKN